MVQNFTTYWVMAESPAIQVSGQPTNLDTQPPAIQVSGQPTNPPPSEDTGTNTTGTNTTALIKAHGMNCQSLCTSELCAALQQSACLLNLHSLYVASLMTLAWGLVAPVGIILAMFYKVVWPNGEWFYVRSSLKRICQCAIGLHYR